MIKRLLFIICFAFSGYLQAQQLAFPGAEGFGRYTTGGRGGAIYAVTNLNDSGAGSLRDAVTRSGARTIVFRVSGTISLNSTLNISNPNITIAGQTAPGDGITIKNYPVNVNTDNVIIRYIRFRMGDEAQQEADALGGRYRKDIIVDHCSMSWSTDECVSFYDNENLTLQWCLIAESLRNSLHEKGTHGYGGIWGGRYSSFHHNLLAHHDSRNPRLGGIRTEVTDMRNNVIYNWNGNSGYGAEGLDVNIVNCYYKPGPATASSRRERIFSIDKNKTVGGTNYDIWGRFYINGNFVDGSTRATEDNWTYGVYNQFHNSYGTVSEADKAAMRMSSPHDIGNNVVTHSAEQAYELVLQYAGASLRRDAVDERILNTVLDRSFTAQGSKGSTNGIIDSQADVGGWPVLQSLPAPQDTDNDGMPDAWETANGLNPDDASDRNGIHASGYTNLELYLNSLVALNVTGLPQEKRLEKTEIFPNPSTGVSAIAFTLKQQSQVRIEVTDLAGKQVNMLLNSRLAPGNHEVKWNGTDVRENSLPAGIYLVSVQTENEHIVKRLALLRE
ncbi:T9SS type A sorting domain-containing protein [Pontibacter qinzhouensis]|uniref:T9SS type A sorting domain-containing protein n=1 Tax=Pontibacter qinzhouensis TaxID=2603253 RepID=A0A5C8JK09_9BACT|nr:T9SS type A sorting domain-containing protein [Pontibacter qinzhouensis]TXK37681.1 T9SS type A sorting domain-containing protein [Pontibacter qinzhouensis]